MSPIDIYRYLKSFFKFLNGKSVFHVARDGTAILYGSKNCHWKMIPIQKCLDRDIIVYSFGLGEDIQFEKDVSKRHDCVVYAFDPTPKSLNYVKNTLSENSSIKVYPYALSDKNCTLDFFLPKNPNYVSGSLTKSPGTSDSKIEVEAHSIQFLMEKFGHTEIDVLKMDIEGAEYDVLESLIDSGTINNIGQICVEFHFRFGCGLVKKTEEIFKSLKNKGFKLVYAAANQEEFTFARINSDNFNLKKTRKN